LKKIEKSAIKRGNVLLSIADKPLQCVKFEAEISVLKSHSTTIKIGYEPVVHTCSIRQTARIIAITNKKCARKGVEDDILRTGDLATVHFDWCYRPEFLQKGYRLLLAEGRVKVIGVVTNVLEKTVKVEK